MTSVFTLTAASNYIVRGTQYAQPFCRPYCGTLDTPQQNIDLATPYIDATVNPPAGQPNVFVNYPASFWPVSVGYFHAMTYDDAVAAGVAALPSPGTIDSGSVIFGYSQGANVATQYKRSFNQYWANNPGTPPAVSFVLIGNGNRPNGGALERFRGLYIPGLDFTFSGATPTTTAGAAPGQITTYDIAQQYDGFADFPTNPLNPFAMANAAAGLVLVHPNYQNVDPNSAIYQGSQGDTAYYLIPTYPVPLLMPIAKIPGAGPIIADTLDPVMRVLIESGYDRTINPGQPTPANIFYFPNPVKFAAALAVAIPTGLFIGLEDLAGERVPGTPPAYVQGQGAYGIFGPPVTLPNQPPPPVSLSQVMAAASLLSGQSQTGNANPTEPQQVSATQTSALSTQTPAPPETGGSGTGEVGTEPTGTTPTGSAESASATQGASTTSEPEATKPSLPPLLPLLTKPKMNVVRGTTTTSGKSVSAGTKDPTSSLKSVVTKTITSIEKALGTKPAGAKTQSDAATSSSAGAGA
ncbi:PE-PPE domain-containing protein [Mycolicibacterium brisbanense]|nr:PE-PPE domain-containing protein [Mycolicibacterium brisbanense]